MIRRKRSWLVHMTVALVAMLLLSACGGAKGTTQEKASGSAPAATPAPAAKPAAWAPTSPVEFVVPFKAGGGSDNMARFLASVIEQEKLAPQSLNIVNKDGGAGAVGFAYAVSKKADKHTLVTTNDSVVSVPLQPSYQGPGYKDAVFLAILAMDDFLIVVPANSPYKTIEELIAFGKANPGKLKLATSAAGGEDHVFGSMVEKASGVKFTYVHTKGGAEAMQQVVGGHVDIAVPNPNETLSQMEGKLVRALAVGSAKRLEILPDLPTLKEKGVNVEFQMFRAIAAPAGIPAEVVTFWEGVFKKVTETPRWKNDYIKKFGLTANFKTGKEAMDIITKTEANYKVSLKDLGVIK